MTRMPRFTHCCNPLPHPSWPEPPFPFMSLHSPQWQTPVTAPMASCRYSEMITTFFHRFFIYYQGHHTLLICLLYTHSPFWVSFGGFFSCSWLPLAERPLALEPLLLPTCARHLGDPSSPSWWVPPAKYALTSPGILLLGSSWFAYPTSDATPQLRRLTKIVMLRP